MTAYHSFLPSVVESEGNIVALHSILSVVNGLQLAKDVDMSVMKFYRVGMAAFICLSRTCRGKDDNALPSAFKKGG